MKKDIFIFQIILVIFLFQFVSCGDEIKEEYEEKLKGKIVYSSNRDLVNQGVSGYEIYILDLETMEETRITDNDFSDRLPKWSSDGSKIVYEYCSECIIILFGSLPRVGDIEAGIYIMDSDGSNKTNLTCFGNYSPDISPDGREVVFDSYLYATFDDINYEIVKVDIETKEIMRLTDHIAYDRHPVWSPDGGKIVFSSDRGTIDENNPYKSASIDIYTMNPDGGNIQRLTDVSEGGRKISSTSQYFWSPDGTKIYYKVSSFVKEEDGYYMMNADGTEQRKLDLPRGISVYSISPDGKWFIGSGRPNGGSEIYSSFDLYVMKVDGKEIRRITFDGYEFNGESYLSNESPDWWIPK